MPAVMKRIEAVRAFRAKSSAEPTRRAALTPARFFFVSQPESDYVLIPEVSSERRAYVPIGLMSREVITSNKNYIIAEPSLFVLGVLQSVMHMAWMRTVAGRLESRYQYSGTMVYNTFPWPGPTDAQKGAIEKAAQEVLDARAKYSGSTLADLYDPVSMPHDLLKAHQVLDRAVDAAYGAPKFKSEAARVAYLFELYQKLAAPLDARATGKRARKSINEEAA